MKWIMNDDKVFVPEIGGMTESEWEQWRNGFVVGEPLPPLGAPKTVESLKKQELVGLYK